MEKVYVESREGGYWISGTRVSLDSVVMAFSQGLSPEAIAIDCFPILTLEQVYGAIAYYLGHKREVDEYLKDASIEFEALRLSTRTADLEFSRKLADARRQTKMASL